LVENETKKGQIFLFSPLGASGISGGNGKDCEPPAGFQAWPARKGRPAVLNGIARRINPRLAGIAWQCRPLRLSFFRSPVTVTESALSWSLHKFGDLAPGELYAMLRLRQQVFVVEQRCIYADCDGIDASCHHLAGWQNGRLAAYARIVPPGVKYAEPSIGRVATAPECRRRGLGRELMVRALDAVLALYGPVPVQIGAQSYLRGFYAQFGFVPGEPFMEDGIPHLHMLRQPG
jgi:ElaA protein